MFTRLTALRGGTRTALAFLAALFTALAATVRVVARRVSESTAELYNRLVDALPARYRARMPRGRNAAVAGLLAGSMVVATPLAIVSATGSPEHTVRPPAATAQADPGPQAPAPTAPAAKAPEQVTGVSAEQAQNAIAIGQVAAERGLPQHATTVALATALQESNLKNLNYGDRDSLGLFQQRPSAGWGSPEQIQDPHYAAGKFLDRLVQVPDWQNLPVTVAAQKVQASAFPDAYAKWQPLAEQLTPQVQPGH